MPLGTTSTFLRYSRLKSFFRRIHFEELEDLLCRNFSPGYKLNERKRVKAYEVPDERMTT